MSAATGLSGAVGGPDAAGRPTGVDRWNFAAEDRAAADKALTALVKGLQARDMMPDDVFAAEVVFAELIGNAVRHAPGPIQVMVDWQGRAPVLHVVDQGPGFSYRVSLPVDVLSESGRGLFLVSTLTEEFHVTGSGHGGSHARAVLAQN
ncbi:MAG: ATP-binding protein [Candidatus Eremiobacteraeota bacterium]|nr:ATP-binding protein [Candidatus Eremiobacteraeota bacterium]MBC5826595.1 ATP-binding protein [Candidatus Eremiobacteraeota bacterium]